MNIVFEDSDILVIDKPPGLVVDESLGQKLGGLIAHRLDKNTSGLLVVAKTQKALLNLQAQFKSRAVKKEYLVLVHGQILEKGVVEGALGRNPGNRLKFAVLGDGKEASTEYEPISNFETIFKEFNQIQIKKLQQMNYGKLTLLRCFPRTGRTHQIRVHLKYIGHPIVSDEKYVGRKMYRLDKRWCPRQFLHAAKIGFSHPITGEWVEFESELPEDLTNCLKLLTSDLSS